MSGDLTHELRKRPARQARGELHENPLVFAGIDRFPVGLKPAVFQGVRLNDSLPDHERGAKFQRGAPGGQIRADDRAASRDAPGGAGRQKIDGLGRFERNRELGRGRDILELERPVEARRAQRRRQRFGLGAFGVGGFAPDEQAPAKKTGVQNNQLSMIVMIHASAGACYNIRA